MVSIYPTRKNQTNSNCKKRQFIFFMNKCLKCLKVENYLRNIKCIKKCIETKQSQKTHFWQDTIIIGGHGRSALIHPANDGDEIDIYIVESNNANLQQSKRRATRLRSKGNYKTRKKWASKSTPTSRCRSDR